MCECLIVSDAESESISSSQLLLMEHAPLFDPIDIAHSEYVIRTGQWPTQTHVLTSGHACAVVRLLKCRKGTCRIAILRV